MRRGRVAREARRSAAEERQAARDKRTDEQQHRKLVNVQAQFDNQIPRPKQFVERDDNRVTLQNDLNERCDRQGK